MSNKYLDNKRLSIFLFLSMMVIYALVYMTKNCFSAAMVLLVEEGALTKTQTGTISAMFYLVYAPFQIIGGVAADKYPPHRLISIGLVGAAVVNLIILFNNSYYVMMAVWSFNAIIQFGLWPAVFKITSTWLAPAHRSFGLFYISLAGTIGLICSYLVAGIAPTWQFNFKVSSIVLIMCSVFWLIAGEFFYRSRVEEHVNAEETGSSEKGTSELIENVSGKEFLHIVLKSGLLLILPVVILSSVFSIGVQAVTPSMISENYVAISTSVASVLNIIPIVVGLCGKFCMDFYYRKKRQNECMLLFLSLMMLVPILCAMLSVGHINVWVIVVLVSLVVLLSNASTLLTVTYMPQRFKKTGRTGTISGLINAMASLGIVLANFVSTRVADNYGWVEVIIVWILFAAAAALIAVFAIRPWKRFTKKSK